MPVGAVRTETMRRRTQRVPTLCKISNLTACRAGSAAERNTPRMMIRLPAVTLGLLAFSDNVLDARGVSRGVVTWTAWPASATEATSHSCRPRSAADTV